MKSNSKSLAAILALTTTTTIISSSLAENDRGGGVVADIVAVDIGQRNKAEEHIIQSATGGNAVSSNNDINNINNEQRERRLRRRHSSTTQQQQQQQQSGVRLRRGSRKLTRNNPNNTNKANRQRKKIAKWEEAQQQQQQQQQLDLEQQEDEQASDVDAASTAAEIISTAGDNTATATSYAANDKKDDRTFATLHSKNSNTHTSPMPMALASSSTSTSTSTSTSAAQHYAPGCGPSPGTHHSPYLGCYSDKPNSRAFSFQLYGNSNYSNSKSKRRFNHGALDCERECTKRGFQYIGRQFKGQCFCGDEVDLERARGYTTDSDVNVNGNGNGNGSGKEGLVGGCDCCGQNVGGGKMCVWENANHPNSQAQAPSIPAIVPAIQHQSQMVQQPVHHVQVSSTSSSSATSTSLSIANNSYSNQVMRPNSSSVSSATNNNISNKQPIQVSTSKPIGAFRLRLHWQPGYNWQNSPREKFWCMECRGQCINNAKIQIDKCSSTDIRQKFIAIGTTIRPASNPALCLTTDSMKGGTSNPVKLKYCSNSSPAAQSFHEVKGNGKFELQPKNGYGSRCLSQHHHPKPYEVVFPERCEKTRMHDTTYWRTY